LDGTFWSTDELQHRDINEIPHPTVEESLRRLGDKKKDDPDIRFLHLNHTNPLCNPHSKQTQIVREMGWAVAKEGDSFTLESL
jgi:pyrroloquinoline quinone biosynthesis protein B